MLNTGSRDLIKMSSLLTITANKISEAKKENHEEPYLREYIPEIEMPKYDLKVRKLLLVSVKYGIQYDQSLIRVAKNDG